jgi:hypothetical protein
VKQLTNTYRLVAVAIIAVAFACSTGAATALAAPPANDNFANATVIGTLPFSDNGVDTTQATTEPGEPIGCGFAPFWGNTVWYTITPTSSEVLRFGTGASTYLPVVNIYTGSSLGSLSLVQCTSFGAGSNALHATANTTYYVQIGNMFSSGGTLNLSVAAVPPPPNDDFANATVISPSSLPFSDNESMVASTTEQGEPSPSCGSHPLPNSIWYSFTPSSTGSYTATMGDPFGYGTEAVYSGTTLSNLSEIGCSNEFNPVMTFHATAGTTYYLQNVDTSDGSFGSITIGFDHTPQPTANFWYSPSDPSTADVVQFYGLSSDPGQAGFTKETYNFGDGTTAAGCCTGQYGATDATHQYASDGDYTVTDTVTTTDGRVASTQQVIHVRTHDVSISQLTVPLSAKAGQTKPISATVRDSRYPETVRVDLYESVGSSFQQVGSETQSVPAQGAKHPTTFAINYTFSTADAQAGKVVFEAVATIVGYRDAFPADNTTYSPATRVSF